MLNQERHADCRSMHQITTIGTEIQKFQMRNSYITNVPIPETEVLER
jgi:hypothetical protein